MIRIRMSVVWIWILIKMSRIHNAMLNRVQRFDLFILSCGFYFKFAYTVNFSR
jgi:hypothetical protein